MGKLTTGDAILDKRGIIRATVELSGHVSQALALKELLVVLLNDIRTSRAGEVEGASVSVVDGELGVRGGNHVEVEVGADLGNLLLGAVELLDVEVGAELAVLFGAPEAEADSVLDFEVGQGLGNGEDTNGTGAVVTGERMVSCES